MACAPSEDSDQPRHRPSLKRAFAVPIKKAWVLSYPLSTQRRLWSDWANAQADLSLHWAQRSFCWFCHEAAPVKFALVGKSELVFDIPPNTMLSEQGTLVYMTRGAETWVDRWQKWNSDRLFGINSYHMVPQKIKFVSVNNRLVE